MTSNGFLRILKVGLHALIWGCLNLGGGDVVARDNGGKAVGKFSKVKVRALVVWNLQGGE